MNAAAEKMFGYGREELLGKLIEVLVPESLRHRHREHRRHYAEHPVTRPMGTGLELFARRKDGSQFPVEISLSPIRSADGSRVIAIVRDITSRKQAEAQITAIHQQFAVQLAATNQQLEIRNREVEQANRLKSEFLASMSHELRTPLHTIIGFADLLAEELKGALNRDQKRFVGHIQRDSHHLLELINDILDLSKIESGRLELHAESFNAAQAITETVASLRALADDKQIKIVEVLDSDIAMAADRLRFKEILNNLLSNAIKFTPENGRITIECHDDIDDVYFAIADTGVGIHAAEQQAIFDKFYQLGSTTRGVREGTGLGLAITKSLVEMHGGKIWVDSTPGEGSRFQFVIPHAKVKTRSQAIEPAAARLVLLIGSGPEQGHLVKFLVQRGYGAVAAQTIPEGLAVTGNTSPAALILDLTKVGSEIRQILQDLRANEKTAQVPLIALTAADSQNTAAMLGVNAALLKPVDPALLLRILDEKIVHSPGEPSRILIVDDEAAAREMIAETLRSARFLPVLASTGKQALEVLARGPISAVVVDLVMPEMSGFELILRIRQNPRLAELPIVVLTGKEIDLDDAQLLRREANAVFLKVRPWKEELLTKLDELVQHVINRDPIRG